MCIDYVNPGANAIVACNLSLAHAFAFKIELLTSNLPQCGYDVSEFLVSKETVVLRRWERSKQKFGFIKRVDKG